MKSQSASRAEANNEQGPRFCLRNDFYTNGSTAEPVVPQEWDGERGKRLAAVGKWHGRGRAFFEPLMDTDEH
jgi:hypothetical protein